MRTSLRACLIATLLAAPASAQLDAGKAQAMMREAARRAGQTLPSALAFTKLAIADSALDKDQAADCAAKVDAVAKELQAKYEALKDEKTPPTPELLNPFAALMEVVRKSVNDEVIAQSIAAQAYAEQGLSNIGGMNPPQAVETFRRYIAKADPTEAQQKQIDPILKKLDDDLNAATKTLPDKTDPAIQAEVEKLRPQLAAMSQKAWDEVRAILTKEQRQKLSGGLK